MLIIVSYDAAIDVRCLLYIRINPIYAYIYSNRDDDARQIVWADALAELVLRGWLYVNTTTMHLINYRVGGTHFAGIASIAMHMRASIVYYLSPTCLVKLRLDAWTASARE